MNKTMKKYLKNSAIIFLLSGAAFLLITVPEDRGWSILGFYLLILANNIPQQEEVDRKIKKAIDKLDLDIKMRDYEWRKDKK